eukprot:TRINITY_DN2480_c0_g3_i1.p2 TRINITY_DN2480_c0_g3~~TRINITY_DN2480_c0_g3_i1.p2  ORF type:complete len:183 (-),score=9.97 TRINITY_DN2480_c0_g3_i1:124-672(-)
MNIWTLILYGLIDLLLEFAGLVIVFELGFEVKLEEEIVSYGSIALDLLKALSVIAGFICICIISGGTSDESKKHLKLTVTIIQWTILVPAVIIAGLIIDVIIKDPPHYFDVRPLLIAIFLIYVTLKFVTFFGFCEFLKNFIHDVPRVEEFGGFRYLPVNLYGRQQESYQFPRMTYDLQSYTE